MANRRIFYAVQSVGFSPYGSTTYIEAHGVQNAGITTNFQLEPVLELGQISVYENVEMVPDIEFTAEKAIDGYPLLHHLATQTSPANTLVARSNVRTTIALSIFSDLQQSASGTSIAEVDLSGMYWSGTTLTFSTDTTFKESFTAVGNDKIWRDIAGGASMNFSGFFLNNDSPFALTSGSGGIQRKEDFVFYPFGNGSPNQENGTGLDVNGQLVAFLTILPPDIPGISSSGTNDRDSAGNFGAHVSNISTSVSLGRDPIYELGRKGPYFRFVNFPVQVTTDIEIIATKWDAVSGTSTGIITTGINAGENLVNRSIRIRTREGTYVDLGVKNKLQNVSYTGGDTGGGNVTVRYSYITYSDFTTSHPRDPSNATGCVWPTP